MDIDTLDVNGLTLGQASKLIEKANEVAQLMGRNEVSSAASSSDDVNETQAEINKLIGSKLIYRCRNAGVHFGELVSFSGQTAIVKDSRRLWYWKAAGNEHTLSGVARQGLSDSKCSGVVEKLVLPEVCELISMTDKAIQSVEAANVYHAD